MRGRRVRKRNVCVWGGVSEETPGAHPKMRASHSLSVSVTRSMLATCARGGRCVCVCGGGVSVCECVFGSCVLSVCVLCVCLVLLVRA